MWIVQSLTKKQKYNTIMKDVFGSKFKRLKTNEKNDQNKQDETNNQT